MVTLQALGGRAPDSHPATPSVPPHPLLPRHVASSQLRLGPASCKSGILPNPAHFLSFNINLGLSANYEIISLKVHTLLHTIGAGTLKTSFSSWFPIEFTPTEGSGGKLDNRKRKGTFPILTACYSCQYSPTAHRFLSPAAAGIWRTSLVRTPLSFQHCLAIFLRKGTPPLRF